MMNEFEKVFQSHKTIAFNQNHPLKASVIITQLPSGRGKFSSVQKLFNEISGVKVISNQDSICLVRAVLIGQAYADKEKNAYLLLRKNNRELNKRVKRLAEKLNIPKNKSLGVETIKLLEAELKEYQITLLPENRLLHDPLAITFVMIFASIVGEKTVQGFLFLNLIFFIVIVTIPNVSEYMKIASASNQNYVLDAIVFKIRFICASMTINGVKTVKKVLNLTINASFSQKQKNLRKSRL
jgi:hypothetical protein